MSLQKLMTNSVNYNLWVTEQYIKWLSSKTEEQFNSKVASSYPSIMKTLSHIWQTQAFWYGVITGKYFDAEQYVVTSKEQLLEALLESSREMASYVSSLSESDLHREIEVKSPWFESNLPRYEYIQHAINHGFYHRGQIVTIGRNIGITDAPMTDYNFYNIYRLQSETH